MQIDPMFDAGANWSRGYGLGLQARGLDQQQQRDRNNQAQQQLDNQRQSEEATRRQGNYDRGVAEYDRTIGQENAAQDVNTRQAASRGMFQTRVFNNEPSGPMGPPSMGEDEDFKRVFGGMGSRAQSLSINEHQQHEDRQYTMGRQATADGYASDNHAMRRDQFKADTAENERKSKATADAIDSDKAFKGAIIRKMVESGTATNDDVELLSSMNGRDILHFHKIAGDQRDENNEKQGNIGAANDQIAELEELKKHQGGLTEVQKSQLQNWKSVAKMAEGGAKLDPMHVLTAVAGMRGSRQSDPALERGRTYRFNVSEANKSIANIDKNINTINKALSYPMNSAVKKNMQEDLENAKRERVIAVDHRENIRTNYENEPDDQHAPAPAPAPAPVATVAAAGTSDLKPDDFTPEQIESAKAAAKGKIKWDTASKEDRKAALVNELRAIKAAKK